MHALGALGEPEDVAAMIVHLLGNESRWITGQVFGVDGGLATVRAKPGA
jgi:NAD(P)-dependent dehydrogenase (short-subunit alcohol dehydrogenase family)